jgi:hypothetical protein
VGSKTFAGSQAGLPLWKRGTKRDLTLLDRL